MERQFTSFYLGENLMGIDVLLIREINHNMDITQVDPSPKFLRGLMNLRGQIVAVTDLGIRLGLEKHEITRDTCCIVLKTTEELENFFADGLVSETTSKDIIGLVVDKIGDMVSIDQKEIEPPPANMHGIDGKYLSGIVKLSDSLLAVLRVKEVLAM